MLIVPPKVELMKRPYSPIDRARHVELCGRVCYKSEEKIAEGTAEQFIANLIKRGHEAMLEHSRVMIRITREVYLDGLWFTCARYKTGTRGKRQSSQCEKPLMLKTHKGPALAKK